jgi:uncharacterized protein (DUF983 family)
MKVSQVASIAKLGQNIGATTVWLSVVPVSESGKTAWGRKNASAHENPGDVAVRPPVQRMLANAWRSRCPRCGEGELFRAWPNQVRHSCLVCGLPYFREQGYFVGGMVITYLLAMLVIVECLLRCSFWFRKRAGSRKIRKSPRGSCFPLA